MLGQSVEETIQTVGRHYRDLQARYKAAETELTRNPQMTEEMANQIQLQIDQNHEWMRHRFEEQQTFTVNMMENIQTSLTQLLERITQPASIMNERINRVEEEIGEAKMMILEILQDIQQKLLTCADTEMLSQLDAGMRNTLEGLKAIQTINQTHIESQEAVHEHVEEHYLHDTSSHRVSRTMTGEMPVQHHADVIPSSTIMQPTTAILAAQQNITQTQNNIQQSLVHSTHQTVNQTVNQQTIIIQEGTQRKDPDTDSASEEEHSSEDERRVITTEEMKLRIFEALKARYDKQKPIWRFFKISACC